MSLKQAKLDVTDKVVGKIKGGEIQFFLENEQIGKMSIPNGASFELTDKHFETAANKVFKNVTITDSPEERYTDCDEGGWC